MGGLLGSLQARPLALSSLECVQALPCNIVSLKQSLGLNFSLCFAKSFPRLGIIWASEKPWEAVILSPLAAEKTGLSPTKVKR